MNSAVVASCVVALAMVVGVGGAVKSAWAAPRHRCPSLKKVERQEKLQRTGSRVQKMNAQARVLTARAMAAYKALRFSRALDLSCVLATHRRFARRSNRFAWVFFYTDLLARHRGEKQAIGVLRRMFAKSFRHAMHRGRYPVLRAALTVSRYRVQLARRERRSRKRKRLYRKARGFLRRTLVDYQRIVNRVGGKRAKTALRKSKPWPRLTKKLLRTRWRTKKLVLRFAEALTLSWEVERAVGLKPHRAFAMEALSRDVAQLFGRLPSSTSARRAAASALGWFDLRRSLKRLVLPKYKRFRPKSAFTGAALWRNRKLRTQAIRHSRHAVADALLGLSGRVAEETSRLHALQLALGDSPAKVRVLVRVGLLYDRAAAQLASPRWPDGAAQFVKLFALQFADPSEFAEKIGKLVFGAPSLFKKARLQWGSLATKFYGRALKLANRGHHSATYVRLARSRLARLRGKRTLRRVRIANRTGPRLAADVEPLLTAVKNQSPVTVAMCNTARAQARAGVRHRLGPPPVVRRSVRPRGLPASFSADMAAQTRKRVSVVRRLLRRGQAAVKAKQYARARRILLKAAAHRTEGALALVALGRVQLKLADVSGALRTVGRLEAVGNDKAASQLRGKLQKLAP